MTEMIVIAGWMARLTSVVGWGVVPRMAPPPPKGVQCEREGEREREAEREKSSLIHSFPIRGLNSYKKGRYIGVQAPLVIHTNH